MKTIGERALPENAGVWEKDKDCFFQLLSISWNEHFLFETRLSLEKPQN